MCQSRGDAAGAAKRNQLLYCESESHSVVSNSLRPYGLYSPWNSPGQNTEVGSLSLLQGIFPTQGSNPGFPHHMQILYQLSKNTGVGSLSLLQWIFPTQESNPGLLHYRQILYHLNYQRRPRILVWVAYSFSRGSSCPRNRTGVFCIAAELPGNLK